MPSTPLSRAEFTALGELAKARRQLMVNMFNRRPPALSSGSF